MAMYITISANKVIDEVIAIYMDYEECRQANHKKYPDGQYLHNETPLKDIREYIEMEKAEKALNVIQWCFDGYDLGSIVRVVRKWYKRTEWQYCLSEEMAEKLFEHYIWINNWLDIKA